jgi:hypothetical protein
VAAAALFGMFNEPATTVAYDTAIVELMGEFS